MDFLEQGPAWIWTKVELWQLGNSNVSLLRGSGMIHPKSAVWETTIMSTSSDRIEQGLCISVN
jgi:hypothetical protein